jgi:hypothetical protein
MADEQHLPLEIELLDPIEEIEVGNSYRFQVNQHTARGEKIQIPIDTLDYEFSPIPWGKVVPTDDPGLGTIQVVTIVDPEDVFLAPHYSVEAKLRPHAIRTLAPKKRIRMSALAVEIELGFATGLEGKWKSFQPFSLPRPVDLATAKLSDPAGQKLLVRDGKVFLRIEHLDSFPAELALTFPNGETAAIKLEGGLRGHPITPDSRTRTPIGARPDAPAEDAETAACRHEVNELRTYVASFSGAGKRRPDESTIEGIRRRVMARIDKTKERLMSYGGPAQQELLALFKAATDSIPSYLRETPPAGSPEDLLGASTLVDPKN